MRPLGSADAVTCALEAQVGGAVLRALGGQVGDLDLELEAGPAQLGRVGGAVQQHGDELLPPCSVRSRPSRCSLRLCARVGVETLTSEVLTGSREVSISSRSTLSVGRAGAAGAAARLDRQPLALERVPARDLARTRCMRAPRPARRRGAEDRHVPVARRRTQARGRARRVPAVKSRRATPGARAQLVDAARVDGLAGGDAVAEDFDADAGAATTRTRIRSASPRTGRRRRKRARQPPERVRRAGFQIDLRDASVTAQRRLTGRNGVARSSERVPAAPRTSKLDKARLRFYRGHDNRFPPREVSNDMALLMKPEPFTGDLHRLVNTLFEETATGAALGPGDGPGRGRRPLRTEGRPARPGRAGRVDRGPRQRADDQRRAQGRAREARARLVPRRALVRQLQPLADAARGRRPGRDLGELRPRRARGDDPEARAAQAAPHPDRRLRATATATANGTASARSTGVGDASA